MASSSGGEINCGLPGNLRPSLLRVELFTVQHSHALWDGSSAGHDLGEHDIARLALVGVHLGKTADAGPCAGQHHKLSATRAERDVRRSGWLIHEPCMRFATGLRVEMDQVPGSGGAISSGVATELEKQRQRGPGAARAQGTTVRIAS